MPYLLDTNVWIYYLKQPESRIHAKFAALQPADVVTCSIVRCELLHGAEKYGDRNRRVATVSQMLAPFNSVPFDAWTLQSTRKSATSWKKQDSSLARTIFRLPRSVCVMDSH